MQSLAKLLTVALFMMAAATNGFASDLFMDMTPGVTEVSQKVHGLHRLMFWWCVGIGVVVFGAMFYSILKHRKSQGAEPAQFHENVTLELVWTIVPFVILIAMAIPATKLLIEMHDTSESALTVKVTGSQWKWQYDYLDYEGNNTIDFGFLSVLDTPREQIYTPISNAGLFPKGIEAFEGEARQPVRNELYNLEVDRHLVIPTGQKVRFLITSDDVIHSWWVPDFGIKKDAIPGFINELWTLVPEGKEGFYRGQCAELCGKDHAFMPIVVEAKAPAEFKQWLAEESEKANNVVNQTISKEELMALGEKEYLGKCSACHQANGQGLPPTFPALAGSAVATTGSIAEHVSIIVNGLNAMPAFSGLDLKALAAIVTYERNAWGNDTGDIVQPRDVVAE